MDAALGTLTWILIGSSAGIWLVSMILCRRLSGTALEPLTNLVNSARGLDATDPGWRLDEPATGDELAVLGHAFNELLARLHVAFQSQRQFSSDVSHQLRTPLTVMIGQMQVALRQERTPDEYRRALNSALSKATQLAQVVESLLFLARADVWAQMPKGEPLELRGWVGRFIANGSASNGHEGVDYRAGDDGGLWVRAHPSLLEQLLGNLRDNAVKHGASGAPVVIETRRAGADVILAVEDSGPGIEESDLNRIFQPFYRSEPARRNGVPGVGLGLAVADRIARAMGGSVCAHSELGKGSRFEVRLPLVNPPKGASESCLTPSDLLQRADDSPSSCTLL
jgi:signal transduction histidine kinase